VGDVILSCQGESVSSIAQVMSVLLVNDNCWYFYLVLTLPFQFEDILLGVGEKHLDESDLTCKVHVQVKPMELPLPLNDFVNQINHR
jgi:hypothetical protein